MSDQIEAATTRLRGPGSLRILFVGVASIALAIGAAVALASSAPPTDLGAPGSAAVGPGPADADGFVGLAVALTQDGSSGQAAPGHRGPGAGIGRQGFHQITISAKDGSTLHLKTEDGWTRQIAVTSDTAITRAGVAITLADLKVGDVIAFRQTRNDDGTYRIVEIRVIVPIVAGEVTATSSSSLTLKLRDGSTRNITLTGSTKYALGSQAATLADVKVGAKVTVAGTASGDTFTALSVNIQLQQVAGEVTAKTADTITIQSRDGSTTTIKVGSGTTYRIPGKDGATLADVTVGMQIVAQGTRNADNTFNAASVGAGRPVGPGRGLRIPGGMRGPGLPGSPATPAPTGTTTTS
jgi:hypothetical protein